MDPSRPKIIIVDDDRDARETLAMALELETFEVAQAATGLRLISTLQVDRPDLSLLDVNMSWIDGFELCRAVRKNEDFRSIPVVFVSGRASKEDIRKGLDAGADDYFVKPFDFNALVGRVRELLARDALGKT